MKIGGIVLCGGKSARMGRAKGWLPFGGELLLQRVVRVVREAADEVVVVAGTGQDVPPLPDDVRVVRDLHADRGPLAGLYAGLCALADSCEVVYLSACDAPFLTPAFVRAVTAKVEPTPPGPPSLKGRGARSGNGVGRPAVPFTDRPHPLAAAYPVAILPTVRAMLDANELRMTDLLARVSAHLVPADELRSADPELRSLCNLNTPDDYATALAASANEGNGA